MKDFLKNRKTRKLKKEARLHLKDVRKILKKHGNKIDEHELNMISAEIDDLEEVIQSSDDPSQLEKRCMNFLYKTDKVLKPYKKSTLREYAEAIITAVILALLIRTFIVQAFKIPTGSMQPTLHGAQYYGMGDRILVNKFIYGAKSPTGIMFTDIKLPYFQLPAVRQPQRGDIVVFTTEGIALLDEDEQKKDFIKRLVGLPGDRIEIIGLRRENLFAPSPKTGKVHRIHNPVKIFEPDGAIYIQGECQETGEFLKAGPINKDEGVILLNGETLKDPDVFTRIPYLNEGQFGMRNKSIIVPDNSYYVLGDNSPSSKDSRFWGFVPESNLRGKSFMIYFPFTRFRLVR